MPVSTTPADRQHVYTSAPRCTYARLKGNASRWIPMRIDGPNCNRTKRLAALWRVRGRARTEGGRSTGTHVNMARRKG